MNPTDFTETDLARISLSDRLRLLSEALRCAVAAEDDAAADGGPGLAARLWELTSYEVPHLQEAIAGYALAAGGSWAELAAFTGLSEQEARERWSALPPHLPDPEATATALDSWYVRYAQLEPLARVRDPFTRLLNGRAPGGRVCLVCAKYDKLPVPAWAGHPVPPGGHLLDDGVWRVGHGPTPYWPAGTLLIEAARHFVDYADFTPHEAATIGQVVQRFTEPIKRATGAPRVHIFSCMEGTEHFHLWMVPRVEGQVAGRTFIADPGYCSDTEAEHVVARIRASLDSSGTAEQAARQAVKVP